MSLAYFNDLKEEQQLAFVLALGMAPSLFVYVLIFVFRIEKSRFKTQILRMGMAFGCGALLSDFVHHVCLDTFKLFIEHDHHHHHHDSDHSSNNHTHSVNDHHHHEPHSHFK